MATSESMAAEMTAEMTDEQLAAIRRRLERITEPPWNYDQPYSSWQIYSVPRRKRRDFVDDPTHPEHWELIAGVVPLTYNAAFIANAPADMRALLDEVERLRAQVAALLAPGRADVSTDG